MLFTSVLAALIIVRPRPDCVYGTIRNLDPGGCGMTWQIWIFSNSPTHGNWTEGFVQSVAVIQARDTV